MLRHGGLGGDRTHDLRVANAALSQLSYKPKYKPADNSGFVWRSAKKALPDLPQILRTALFLLPNSIAGGPDGIRTHDPHTASVVRSQLRYRPGTLPAFSAGKSYYSKNCRRCQILFAKK